MIVASLAASCARPAAGPQRATSGASAPTAQAVPVLSTVRPVAAASTHPATQSKPDYPGIWGVWGSGVHTEGRPWLKGHVITVNWNDIEPADGQFDWSALDRKIDKITELDLYVMVLVYVGRHSPEWLYHAGVPRVASDHKGGSSYPYYLNDNNRDGDGDDPGEFRFYFKRMIAVVARHLDQLNNDATRASYQRIIAIQGPVGASGDPQPYERETGTRIGSNGWFGEGTPYAISKREWDAYQKEMLQFYYDQYQATQPRIHTLLNIGDDKAMYDWGLANLPGVWIKYGRIGDRYQNNREYNDPQASSGAWIWEDVREFRDGVAHRSRSEMDLTQFGWFTAAPVWNMYWTNLWGLHTGLDIHNIVAEDLENLAFVEAFTFFTTYAGYKDPRDSPGAWIALRDGLDAADTERFPERTYGRVKNGQNEQRYLDIASAFAADGARQDDPAALKKTSFDALNDVGWKIYPDNYQMWLHQIDPHETSRGMWRVGPKDQPYGRFARRFDVATNKNSMYFDIDDRFFFDQPLNGAYAVTIRVVYLDQGTGRWALAYDAIDDPQKTAAVITKTDTGRWKEHTITLRDGYFGNRGPRNADLVLLSVDGEDDIFHMLEVTRATGFRTGYFGDGDAPTP